MDRRVWLNRGEEESPGRIRVTLTIEEIHEWYESYCVCHGTVERGSMDTLNCPGVRRLRGPDGEWNIEPLHPLAKKYLLRTWEPL